MHDHAHVFQIKYFVFCVVFIVKKFVFIAQEMNKFTFTLRYTEKCVQKSVYGAYLNIMSYCCCFPSTLPHPYFFQWRGPINCATTMARTSVHDL